MNESRRRLKRAALSSVLLAAALCAAARASDGDDKDTRAIEGIVYYTNNSPDDYQFLVELFDSSKSRRVAVKWTEGQTGRFEFKGLKAGVYYLQVVASPRCLLQYEVDVREKQPERLRVFGDADCGKAKVEGLPKPRPAPRDKKR
jgi:hypothetical protein